MHILVTGATGLVGRKLCQKLLEEGNDLTVVGRSEESKFRNKFSFPCNYLTWSELKIFSFRKKPVSKIDAVIHLAGEPIADGKWTKRKKERIYNSRVESTRLLVRFLSENDLLPEVFISASAVGFYGESKNDNAFVETDVSGDGFLAEICRDWEKSSEKLKNKLRLVHMRIGLVFDDKGGFLAELEPLFSKGLGGKIASGNQWMSWVHIDDLVKIFLFSLSNKSVIGPVNAVAPEPTQNKTWTQSFANALKMPALFVVPKIALKLGLGEKAVLALQSQKVVPEKLLSLGYEFDFENVDKALANLYSWKKKPRIDCFMKKFG